MGAFLSKNKVDSNNYEKILSKLDNDIQKKEIQLSDIRIQDRRVGILWILYSSFLWIIYILYYLYALHGEYIDYTTMIYRVRPILLGPICIFYVRKGIKWIYSKRSTSIEINLVSLRKKQILSVEELKKNTDYYSTKSLLERYDPASEKKKQLDEQKRIEEQKLKAQRPVPEQANRIHQPIRPIVLLPQQQQQPQWYDKLVDALVGEVGHETKYALICTHCYTHNGLVLPQEIEDIQYTCLHCHQFNPSRKSLCPNNEPVSPPIMPTTTFMEEENQSQFDKEKQEKQDDGLSNESSVTGTTVLNNDENQPDPSLQQKNMTAVEEST